MKNKGDLYLIRTKLLVYRRQKRVRTEGFSTDSWDKKDFLFSEQNHRLHMPRHREHVAAANCLNAVPGIHKGRQIAH